MHVYELETVHEFLPSAVLQIKCLEELEESTFAGKFQTWPLASPESNQVDRFVF